MNRAYSVLELKAVDEDQRVLEGVATTPRTDRMDDVVEPEGAEFDLPVPFLWQHDSSAPIGHVTKAEVGEDGIRVRVQLAKTDEPGRLKDSLDHAWQSIKAGLVRGLSIGFKAVETADIEGSWGRRFTKWEWLELSAVTIPANADATILAVKSIDTELRAAMGQTQTKGSGASGTVKLTIQPQGGSMNYADRISAFEATRQAKAARRDEIQDTVAEEGRTKDESEREEFDTLTAEIKSIDRELKDLRDLEADNQAKAKLVEGNGTRKSSESRAPVQVVRTREHSIPGIRFTRLAKCIGLAKGINPHALSIAEAKYENDEALQTVLRAAVAAGTASDDTWAGALVGEEGSLFTDFVDFLRPRTIIGRFGSDGIPSLRQIPFRTPFIGQTSGGEGYWVGEGKAKPLTKFDFNRDTLEPLKVANIAVCTMELLRDSSPSAELLVRDQLAGALAARMDIDFINPAKDPAAGVSPASITNGVTPIPSSGNDAESVRIDVGAALAAYVAGNLAPTTAVWVMPATTALRLSLMRNPLGQREFPDISMNGGTFEGFPVLTSQHVPDETVVLVNAEDIYFADEGGISIDVSREASLEMDNDPDGTSHGGESHPAHAELVSLWQTNSVGFLAERTVNWRRRLNRNVGVQVLSDVEWGEEEES